MRVSNFLVKKTVSFINERPVFQVELIKKDKKDIRVRAVFINESKCNDFLKNLDIKGYFVGL